MANKEQTQEQHVLAFFLSPFIDVASERVSHDEVVATLKKAGVDAEMVKDRNAWISFECAERAIRGIVELVGDPLLVKRAGREALSAKHLGILRTIVRAVGTPSAAYRWLADATPRFNKLGRIVHEQTSRSSAVLTYTLAEDVPPERDPLSCATRLANFEALPTMFDLPAASITHPACMHRGDKHCRYEVSYAASQRSLKPLLYLVLGVVGGGLTSIAAGLSSTWLVMLAVTFGIVGFAWGLSRVRGAALRTQFATVIEQQDALELAAVEHEERFAELLVAKTAVDRQVEQRTIELKETAAQLAVTLTEVEGLSRARTDFFANMSHELRTPLTLLMAPLQHLVAGQEPPGGHVVALASMARNSDRLLQTINQLLDLARVEAGSATLERAPVSPHALMTAVTSAFSAAAAAKGVSVTIATVREKAQANFALDAGWLETALTNLVGNALKFTSKGGSVQLSAEDRGDEVVFEVRDTGAGIPQEQLNTLFERFARGSGKGTGSGIGLSLVHEAARLHEGRVEVESTLGEGSRFRLMLPRLLSEGDAAQHAIADQASVTDDCPSQAGPNAAAPFALVVEDNPDVRRFIVDVLAAQYRVKSARNGREALAIITDERPDIVVSDISMPEMDGLELCRALRDNPSNRNIPLILVTARGESAEVLQGFDAGANDYVVKPFHGRELIARAGALVRARRMLGRLVHQERLATVGVVAASVAHHIRNPLNALIGGLPAVRSRLGDTCDVATHKMFDVFIECAERIEDVTTDLLDLSRVDRAERSTFPPGRGLAASVRLMETRFGDGISIDRSIDEETSMIGHAGELHHVFLNLLDNAARATGSAGQLLVVGKRSGEWYEVSVGDDGPGIPPELLSQIFEPFVTTREAGEGTGLGLAIARDVVIQHGGTIEAGTSVLGGAEVKIRLPIAC